MTWLTASKRRRRFHPPMGGERFALPVTAPPKGEHGLPTAFDGFDAETVAGLDEDDVEQLAQEGGPHGLPGG